MVVPTESELRTALAHFAEARFAHDAHPTEATTRALEDVTYTLCVLTNTRTAPQALASADALLEQCRETPADTPHGDATLAA
ncbi:DUF5133 domain-containing protein [Streptomyces sp. NPDC001941]|uniref:DUF5133 domain-containing protein n=1 Tax=Streptomyces sp. NPDC001941 TaxID=3154659 RepID=UPI00331EB47B